jgi:hypothetical protein
MLVATHCFDPRDLLARKDITALNVLLAMAFLASTKLMGAQLIRLQESSGQLKPKSCLMTICV